MKRIENNSNQLEDQTKLIEIQNMEMQNLKKQISKENQEKKTLNKEITDLKKQVENENKKLERKIENQSYESRGQKDDMEKLQPSLNSKASFTPVSTAFQWKVDIESETTLSPPFYNMMNGMCFQLRFTLPNDFGFITLHRYRGKYDHPTNQISTTQPFELVVHMFDNDGNFKVTKFSNNLEDALTIGQSKKNSGAFVKVAPPH